MTELQAIQAMLRMMTDAGLRKFARENQDTLPAPVAEAVKTEQAARDAMQSGPLPPKWPMEKLVEEAGREVGLRRSVYPGFVAKHKMSQAEADVRIDRMERIYRTLQWLSLNEELIKEVHRQQGEKHGN